MDYIIKHNPIHNNCNFYIFFFVAYLHIFGRDSGAARRRHCQKSDFCYRALRVTYFYGDTLSGNPLTARWPHSCKSGFIFKCYEVLKRGWGWFGKNLTVLQEIEEGGKSYMRFFKKKHKKDKFLFFHCVTKTSLPLPMHDLISSCFHQSSSNINSFLYWVDSITINNFCWIDFISSEAWGQGLF